jgi:putative DNA primase/helicase
VRAAITAYANSGEMMDAALAYAEHGYPIFPLRPDKTPIPARDVDPITRKRIPGTGGFKKATTDHVTIRFWWIHNPDALIGMPMGPITGLWATDPDTKLEHQHDGVAAWAALQAEHGAIITREHRTASEGLHCLFPWDPERPISSSAGGLPPGIEVKGKGSYIVVPPSSRLGKAYYVGNDIDPVAAPEWLTELIGTKAYRYEEWTNTYIPADLDMLASALAAIPNDVNTEWQIWGVKVGLALFAATGGSEAGFDLFDDWGKKSPKYDKHETRSRWEHFKGSPPDRTGAHAIFKLARSYGWTVELKGEAAEVYTPEQARAKIDEIFTRFIAQLNSDNPIDRYLRFLEQEFGFNFAVWAVCLGTGLGKTQGAVKIFGATTHRFLYTVPILELADRVADQFRALGLTAAVLRGRMAPDPAHQGQLMCLTPEVVKTALAAHLDVTEHCCKPCAFRHRCSYLAQKQQTPQVWIAAHNILFHKEEALGEFDFIVVDESMWTTALVGIDSQDMIRVPLAAFEDSEARIADALDAHKTDGALEGFRIGDGLLTRTIGRLWTQIDELRKQLDLRRADTKLLKKLRLLYDKKQVCEELRRLGGDVTSGRLELDRDHKDQRIITWRGKREISGQCRTKPTLLLDATLPSTQILRGLHEDITVVADINVALPPSVFIRQVLGVPSGSKKLADEKHQQEVLRYILKRWVETGRQQTLIIGQLKYEKWLKERLPPEIKLLHYNALVGLDDYKAVRLLILIGRTQPGPKAPEAQAGALSGVKSAPATHRNLTRDYTWYTPTQRVIRRKDGRGVPVIGDAHPDPLTEEIRWQICEAEQVQAFGRARAINRTADTPLDVELMFDTVLPIAVDVVENWEEPSLWWETIAEGVLLTSLVDLMKVWPAIWPNRSAAKRTVAEPLPALPGFVEVTYQLAGPRMNKRTGWFDLSQIPDPRQWLVARLGPVAFMGFEPV